MKLNPQRTADSDLVVFRPLAGPASLKPPVVVRVEDRTGCIFPAPCGAGLIEAIWDCAGASVQVPIFRPLAGPASLKRWDP